MAFSSIHAAVVAAALLLLALGSDAENTQNFIGQECTKNFTNNMILQRNINNALLDVVGTTSVSGYAAISYGGDYNTVFGLTWCRGDISPAACSACITVAAQTARAACPDSAESRIWYDLCFLRYENRNFIGQVNTDNYGVWLSGNYVRRNPRLFDRKMGELMGEITAAAFGGKERFGWGETYHAEGNVSIYAMAQCTQDLEDSECCQCLETALKTVSTTCRYRLGCYVVATSCVLRYENYQFLRFQTQPSPSVALAPSN